MSDHCVIICSSLCNGFFNDSRWPYLRELYDIFQHDQMNQLPDMNRLGEYFATNEEYIRKYRFANAFHPFHGFSMMSCGHIAEMNTSAIYIVGGTFKTAAVHLCMKDPEMDCMDAYGRRPEG